MAWLDVPEYIGNKGHYDNWESHRSFGSLSLRTRFQKEERHYGFRSRDIREIDLSDISVKPFSSGFRFSGFTAKKSLTNLTIYAFFRFRWIAWVSKTYKYGCVFSCRMRPLVCLRPIFPHVVDQKVEELRLETFGHSDKLIWVHFHWEKYKL